ncbi:MAG TPA: lysophospholipase [Tepidisphaeraceae bacterium]|nr:lysophospholipase [Tepidisphaeraceae bacterium]
MSDSPVHHDTIASGDHRLHRITAAPDGIPSARLAILHGYGDHAGRFVHFMRWMAERDVACYAIDQRGHGESTGRRCHINNWSEYLDDLATFMATPELATKTDQPPLFVLGHSHGGLVVAAAGIRQQLDRCRGVILSSPYLDLKMPVPWHKRWIGRIGARLFPAMPVRSGVADQPLSRDPQMNLDTQSDPHCLGIATPRWFETATAAQAEVRAKAAEFQLPLLMLVATADTIANPTAAVAFYEHCGSSDRTLKVYEGFRHELLRELGREQVFEDVLDFVRARANTSAVLS